MAQKENHNWDAPAWLVHPVPSSAFFHDQEVEVYEGYVKINDITLWRDNYRTLLDLDQLKALSGQRRLEDLTDDEVISYILKEGLHKITDLAGSIKRNGVRDSLILTYNTQLLDGNRRFLACRYLMSQKDIPSDKFTQAPAKCLPPKASSTLKLKIISEMNFLDPHKEPWPREVRARFALEEFQNARQRLGSDERAYDHVAYLLEIPRADLKRFRAVLGMIHEYVTFAGEQGEKAKQEAERLGRSKFQFFEEFYNKALSGPRSITTGPLLNEAKKLLYRYIWNQQLLSTGAVREFASVVRYEPARKELTKKSGGFLIAKSIYDDYATPRKASARITRFCEWLEGLGASEKAQVPKALKLKLLSIVKPFAQ